MSLGATPGPVADPVVALVAGAVLDRSPKGIAAAVHRLIRAGRLGTGDRLPTVRDLAKELGISPATVSEAWQALAGVGAIQARGRAGTFVRTTMEPTRPSRYLGIGGDPLAEGINLSTGTPDPALLPPLRDALERVLGRSAVWTTSYLDDPVLPELDAVLRAGWPFDPARLTVVDGALDAMSRIVDQVVRLGDRVAMENPGFPPLIDLLERSGAEVIALAMDDSGVVPESLAEALLLEPVAVFLQPRAQNPTGTSMSRSRCAELAALLEPVRALVVEDDHSGDIATGEDVSIGRHLPERTVHIRSYSKSHGPDLRIAAVGGVADVVDPVVSRRMLGPGWTSRLLQAVLVELLTDPAAVAAVTRARSTYAVRSLAVRAGLAGESVLSTTGEGINAWVEVRDERAALISLAAQGIRVSPGSPFMVAPGGSAHVRVTTGVLDEHDPAQLQYVIGALARAAGAEPTLRGV
ncbi:MAG: aminotransferase-like domain-containing protein [Candidatus Nanopelagicales bacterium]